MKNPLIRWSVLLLVGLSIGLSIGYFKKNKDLDGKVIPLSADDQTSATVIKSPFSRPADGVAGASDIGGAFALVDQDGNSVTDQNYADTYKLVFFGFTYCPAICPTELQKITTVMDELGADLAQKITPIFITVDPERDTPEQIKSYIHNFHPRMVGLTGNDEQIAAVMKSFKVFASKIEAEFMEGYMMDHSAFTYLMSPENSLIAIYPSSDTAAQIVADISARNF